MGANYRTRKFALEQKRRKKSECTCCTFWNVLVMIGVLGDLVLNSICWFHAKHGRSVVKTRLIKMHQTNCLFVRFGSVRCDSIQDYLFLTVFIHLFQPQTAYFWSMHCSRTKIRALPIHQNQNRIHSKHLTNSFYFCVAAEQFGGFGI